MDNFVLFICGITITLISGMGVLVYMVSLGYKQAPRPKLPKQMDDAISVVHMEVPVKNKSMESFTEIPSVS